MSKVVAIFLDRLAERLTALVAGLVSSRVATLHAADQAEQQSQLEDLARKYDAADKPHIAATLRQRANSLASPELAEEGVAFVHRLTAEPRSLAVVEPATAATEISGIPDFTSASPKQRKKRPSSATLVSGLGDLNVSVALPDRQEPQA
jgi:hypothetical protein